MKNQTVKINQIIAVLQIVGLMLSQNVLAADQMTALNNKQQISVVSPFQSVENPSEETMMNDVDPAASFEDVGALQPADTTLEIPTGTFLSGQCTQPDSGYLTCIGLIGTEDGVREIRRYNGSDDEGLIIYDLARDTQQFISGPGVSDPTLIVNESSDGKYLVVAYEFNGGPVIQVIELLSMSLVGSVRLPDYLNGASRIDEIHNIGSGQFSIHTHGVFRVRDMPAVRRTFNLAIRPDGHLDLGEVLPEGWTRAISNNNFAFQIVPVWSFLGKGLRLLDLKTGVEQTLAAYAIESYGDNIFKVYDVSPDGQFVVFADKNGSEARLQRIDNPASKISILMDYGLNKIEWTGTGSAASVVLTNLGGSQKVTVNLSGITYDTQKNMSLTITKQDFLFKFQESLSYVNGVLAGKQFTRYGSDGVIASVVNSTFYSNGKVKETWDYRYTKGVATVLYFKQYDSAGMILKAITQNLFANGKVSEAWDSRYTSGIATVMYYAQYDSAGTVLRATSQNLFANGKVSDTWDHRYTNGVITVMYYAQYDSAGTVILKATTQNLFANGKVSESWDLRYVNGVASTLYYGAYDSNGTVLRALTQTYYANGKIGESWDYCYRNGVVALLYYGQYAANGTILRAINQTFHSNGKVYQSWDYRYTNGVVSALYYALYDVFGKMRTYLWQTYYYGWLTGSGVYYW